MLNKIDLISEELLINELIFSDDENLTIRLKNINMDKLVSFSSKELVLPLIYHQINKKKINNLFPSDLINYLEFIYAKNLERNKELIKETNQIGKILNHYKIDYVILKGAANLVMNLYQDKGIRMIGDIDILVSEKDCHKAFNLLVEMGYVNFPKYNFFWEKNIHLQRQWHSNKLFAVEIHHSVEINKSLKIWNKDDILKNKIKIGNVFVPNYDFQFLHNIYNFQIRNHGHLLQQYSYRNYYDTKLLKEKIDKSRLEKFLSLKFVRDYFIVAKMIKLSIVENIDTKKSNLYLILFKLKRKNKILKFIINKLIYSKIKMKFLPQQFIEFFMNRDYRKYLLKKLLNFR